VKEGNGRKVSRESKEYSGSPRDWQKEKINAYAVKRIFVLR
jgi:hypothetical protein